MGDQMSAFGDSGAGTLLKSLFYMTPAGQRYAQATNMIEGGQHRKRLEERLRAYLERQQAEESEQGQLTPYILDPERTETQPFSGTFRFPTTAKEYAALAEKGRERIGKRHAATALEPFSTPTLTGEDMGEVGTWPGAVRLTPGPAGPTPPPVEQGSTGGPVRYEPGTKRYRVIPPSSMELLEAAERGGAPQGIPPPRSRIETVGQEPGRTVQEGEPAYTGEPPLMERRPGAPGPPTVDVLKPPRAGVGTVAEELRPPTFPEAYRRVPERYRELAVPYLVEKAKAGLFKDDAGKQAGIAEALVDSFVTGARSRAAALREAGQPEEAARFEAEATDVAADPDARKHPQAAKMRVQLAQRSLTRLTNPWEAAKKEWGLDNDLVALLRSKLGVKTPQDITDQKVDTAMGLREASRVRVFASQGRDAAMAPLQPAAPGGIPTAPTAGPTGPPPMLPSGPGAPRAGAPGETVLGAKTRIEQQTKAAVELDQPIGEEAAGWIQRDTGLAPDAMMSKREVLRVAIPVTPAQRQIVASARRGLTILQEFERPEVAALFPKAPGGGPLVGAVRAKIFGIEARIRAMSQPEYASLITAFAAAIPALAKATGEVGNLSEFEQEVVRQGIGISRTREAFVAGIRTYRNILERGFRVNGLPLPAELRETPSGPAKPPTPPPGMTPGGLSPAKQKRLEELRQEKAREQGRP